MNFGEIMVVVTAIVVMIACINLIRALLLAYRKRSFKVLDDPLKKSTTDSS